MYLAGGKNLWRNDSLNAIALTNNIKDSISQGWIKFPDTVPTAGAKITALAVSKNPANIVYYGTSSQKVYRIDNASTGTPLAINITGASFPAGANVSSIAVDPNDAGNVMVAFSNYSVYSIFYSVNADSTAPTWTKAAGNLEQNSNTTGTGNGQGGRLCNSSPAGAPLWGSAAPPSVIADSVIASPAAIMWVRRGSGLRDNARTRKGGTKLLWGNGSRVESRW